MALDDNISAAEILQIGLENVGFPVQRQLRTCLATNITRFRASFGASPETCCAILTDLKTTQIVDGTGRKQNGCSSSMSMQVSTID